MRFAPWLIVGLVPLLAAPTRVPVTVHVLVDDDGRAATDAQIATWLEVANARYAEADVELVLAGVEEVTRDAVIDDVGERHALASEAAADGTIHVIAARSIADKDVEGAWINGVHWRYDGGKKAWRGRRYVILAASQALDDTCAHELGHFFGLGHRTEADNLMTAPGRDDGAELDAGQVKVIRASLRKLIKRGAIVPVAE